MIIELTDVGITAPSDLVTVFDQLFPLLRKLGKRVTDMHKVCMVGGVAHEEVVLHVIPEHPLVQSSHLLREGGILQSAEQFDVVVVEADG